MTDKQLIKNRWKYSDKLLRQEYANFKNIFKDIQNELIELFDELNINRSNLNNTIPPELKKRLERKKREWKESGIMTPYFSFLISTTNRLTYSNVLKLFVFAIYLKYQKREFDKSKEIFVKVANNCYEQAKTEIPEEITSNYKDLTWKIIRDWTIVQTINVPFQEYIEILNQTASEEASRLFINTINQDLKLDETRSTKMIEKQLHRLISIKNNKYSGVIENISRQVGNLAYTEPFPNQLVKFVAEMDDRTTKMCMSMNNFIFNTKDKNIFYRYSDEAKTKIRYEIDGLQLGINQPPIMDHFHYCRSILTYQIDLTDEEIRKQLRQESIA